MKTIMIFLVAALMMLAGCEACHNSTGACHRNGKFECLDGSLVTGHNTRDPAGSDGPPKAMI